jgi:ubiquinone/menaquinone biosynthesis C-methylase UbiE
MPDFGELKRRQAIAWSAGRFEVVAESLRDMHQALVHMLGPRPGERWLDLGCGVGSVAELAAGAGAEVTGIDLAPRMIEVAKARAEAGGYEIDYRVGDVEHLEVEDASFDVVVSSVGVIFAPDHDAVARELARVVRRDGRLALSAWTPDGSMGVLARILALYQPPVEGADSPVQWGSEPYVRSKLARTFELRIDRRTARFEDPSLEEAWASFSTSFGPVKSLLESLEQGGRAELERTLLDYFAASLQPDGRVVDDAEYLLVTGIRR